MAEKKIKMPQAVKISLWGAFIIILLLFAKSEGLLSGKTKVFEPSGDIIRITDKTWYEVPIPRGYRIYFEPVEDTTYLFMNSRGTVHTMNENGLVEVPENHEDHIVLSANNSHLGRSSTARFRAWPGSPPIHVQYSFQRVDDN